MIVIIIATILSAVLYRLGGSAKDGSWYDFLKWSKTRDWGCTIVALVALGMLGKVLTWYWYIPTFIACWLALTTYWDDLFGYDCYAMHMAVVALSFLLFPIFVGNPLGFIGRIFMMLLCGNATHWIDKQGWKNGDVISELFRGAAIVATLPLMFI